MIVPVVELVYTMDLKSVAARHVGSNPTRHIIRAGTARSGRFFCKEDIQVGSNPSTSIMKDIMKDREKQIKKLLKRVYKKYGRALKRLAK